MILDGDHELLFKKCPGHFWQITVESEFLIQSYGTIYQHYYPARAAASFVKNEEPRSFVVKPRASHFSQHARVFLFGKIHYQVLSIYIMPIAKKHAPSFQEVYFTESQSSLMKKFISITYFYGLKFFKRMISLGSKQQPTWVACA